MASIDDYTAWVTRDSTTQNIAKLQAQVILHLEKWVYQSGAVFNPEKTVLVHFTRNKTKLEEDDRMLIHIKFGQETVKAQLEVKILGVILDQKLSYKLHIAQAAKKGIKAALAIKRLRNLRPKVTRHLFVSTVAPVVDYASPIWAPGASTSALRRLNNVQRIGAQAIIGGFIRMLAV